MLIKKGKKLVLLQGSFEPGLFDMLKARRVKEAFILEGRPDLNALKDNGKNLLKRKITPVVISDNMAGFLFFKKHVKEVWLAFQTVDKNGAMCAIGSLILAVLAKEHRIPVKCYASLRRIPPLGKERDIFYFCGERMAPSDIKGYVPLLEWIPKKFIKEIIHGRNYQSS